MKCTYEVNIREEAKLNQVTFIMHDRRRMKEKTVRSCFLVRVECVCVFFYFSLQVVEKNAATIKDIWKENAQSKELKDAKKFKEVFERWGLKVCFLFLPLIPFNHRLRIKYTQTHIWNKECLMNKWKHENLMFSSRVNAFDRGSSRHRQLWFRHLSKKRCGNSEKEKYCCSLQPPCNEGHVS